MTLFLTPLVGALTGWSGVLLLPLLTELEVVGTPLSLQWENWASASTEPRTMAFALLFGYAAFLFDQLVAKASQQIDAKGQKGSKSETSDTEE